MDFNDIEIKSIIKVMSEISRTNYLVDDNVRGKVTVISPTKVTVDEAMKILQSILEVKGFAAVPAGKVVKIVPSQEARSKAIETHFGKDIQEIPEDDRIITQIIPLKFADVEPMRAVLQPMISMKNSLLTAYPQTNTLIIIDNASNLRRIVKLIETLDVKPPPSPRKMFVYKLQNAIAKDVGETLKNIAAEVAKTKAAAGVPPGMRREEEPGVVADEGTNSLIVTALPDQYEAMQETIKQLDIMRDQVLVEALIVEMSLDVTLELGLEWQSIEEPVAGSDRAIGSIIWEPRTATVLAQELAKTGLALGLMRGSVAVGGAQFPKVGAILHAFEQNGILNILATPKVTAMDNKKASIFIGKEAPFLTGSVATMTSSGTTTSAGLPTVTSSFTYKKVGIELEMTPRIGKGSVRLEIKQAVEEIDPATASMATPTTVSRKAETTVTVADGGTIVIGGLVQNNKSKTIQKVPGLGDIPFLGAFFRKEKTVSRKTNLLIFITPHIISSPQDAQRITEEQERDRESFLKKEMGKKKR